MTRLLQSDAKPEMTAERVRELFDYDPATGAFDWKPRPHAGKGRRAKSCRVGAISASGHLAAFPDGRHHKVHRLIWLHVYGAWPVGDIDHINRDPADNRLSNLRDVPRGWNVQNVNRARAGSATGLLGVKVKRYRDSVYFQAAIYVDGKDVHLGTFATPTAAHEAYMAAKRIHHPGFVGE